MLALITQLARVPPLHGGSREFKSLWGHVISKILGHVGIRRVMLGLKRSDTEYNTISLDYYWEVINRNNNFIVNNALVKARY
jgi:hypothetical protein